MREDRIAILLGNNPNLIRLWRTNATFRAGMVTFVDHTLPAYLEGLALQAGRHDDEFQRRYLEALNTSSGPIRPPKP